MSTRRFVATEEEDQEHLNFHEDSKSTRRLVASGNSETEGKDKIWPRNLRIIYRLRAEHAEGFLNCETKDIVSVREVKMKNLNMNAAKWRKFMFVTLQAAVHLGTECSENLRSTRNQPKKSLRQLFQVTQKLIIDQD